MLTLRSAGACRLRTEWAQIHDGAAALRHGKYYFDKGDFMQASNFMALANPVSRSAEMPAATAKTAIMGAKLDLRMGLLTQARQLLAGARGQISQFPNAALSAQITELEELAKHTRARPEGR